MEDLPKEKTETVLRRSIPSDSVAWIPKCYIVIKTYGIRLWILSESLGNIGLSHLIGNWALSDDQCCVILNVCFQVIWWAFHSLIFDSNLLHDNAWILAPMLILNRDL